MTGDRLILLVEDNQKISANTTMQLRAAGFGVCPLFSAEDAKAFLEEQRQGPDLMLLDVRLTGMSGIDLIRSLTKEKRLPPTIIMSGEASMAETVEAMNHGVWDFIEKPFTKERLLQSVRNCLEHAGLKRELSAIHSREGEILGASAGMVQLRERIERAAPTSARVLIRGESGTGKELAAETLHRLSTRADKPFIKINCAAIPANLVEDELFGHARGAFTDAKVAKPGLFEEAHRGTLFLDEIGDMDLQLQARLLRVLEDGKVRRIGETHDRQVDVRVIAATNKPLEGMVREGRFREDLYFRLAAVPVDIPPLRERAGDVILLFRHYLDMFCAQNRRRRLTADDEVLEQIARYAWPGNIRELRNVCEQLAIFGTDPLTAEQLPLAIRQDCTGPEAGVLRLVENPPVIPLRDFKEQCEREYIESVLRRTNWNFVAAAKMLGIQRTYLHQKIAALAIAKPGRDV
ncbi:MAG TPA: sigma-54 dependent transcriptional regulator [Thermoanaerobaculia bacterium]|nr:sigma-54 dependent transcriptional regulator [Thermoanaerobaculia bacterium]